MPTTSWLTPRYVSRLERRRLAVRWVRAGRALGGRFPTNRRGSSIEFADYSPYSAGDDVRAIDWKLYARLDRLFVRTYKEEISLSVEVIVDATASMGLPVAAKFERATQIGVSLAYIALIDRHRARLSWFAPGRLAASPWFHRRHDLFRMAELAAAVRPQGQMGLADWTRRAAITLRMRGGQAILVTDGMTRPPDFFSALHAMMVRSLEVKVIQVLSPQELRPASLLRAGVLIDAETGMTHQLAYSPAELERAVVSHNNQLAQFCRGHAIPFAQHQLNEPLEQFITKTLPASGFLH